MKTKLLSLILALTLLLSLAAPVAAGETEEIFSAVVRFEDGADVDALRRELESDPEVNVRWTYDMLFQGVAVETTAAVLERLEGRAGIAMVGLSRTWSLQESFTKLVESSNSLDVMNGLELEYDGDGMVIAVIDSGFRISHEAFKDDSNLDTPAIGEEDIAAFVENGGTDGRYISAKIPFAYDYSGDDRSVHTTDAHGTHVAALAAGYCRDHLGEVWFHGAAPAAQILAMKVFPDKAALGANDADILKAIEDAYRLGADVINLSLGTENGFTKADDMGGLYSETIAKLRAEGVIVSCAVGNSTAALTGKLSGSEYPSGSFTDYGTVCSPASHVGSAAIAAVNSLFYEGGGGLIVGDQVFAYSKTVSESGETDPPDIDALAGQTLPYVVIDGLGKPEDFEGIDLAGCVALVQRGEIYFAEKVQNAAAAGAVACIIYNNEPGTIRAAVENTTIPSAIVTTEVGQFMVTQATNGRGFLMLAPDRMVIRAGDKTSMLDASSWGAMSDLRLVPALSAPGGMILSASVDGDYQYQYMSGTSMAAPNASGAFAVVMQAVGERGIEDRVQRANLAEYLMESTAALVTDEDGTPLSPRRQGAGVIDLAAALESKAVITEPLLEMGDSLKGRFELQFTVKNLSDEELTFTVKPTALTDAFGMDGERYYSMQTPIEITKYMEISGPEIVTVEAGQEKTVRIRMNVSQELKDVLSEPYENGFFVEGFVTLSETSGQQIHATFLGYCGDWEKAPIIEPVDFRDVMNAFARAEEENVSGETAETADDPLAGLMVDTWYNLVYLTGLDMETEGALLLGENPWLVTEAVDARFALPTQESDALSTMGSRFLIKLYTLRNAAHVIMVISDQRTGKIYDASDVPLLPRALISDLTGAPEQSVSFYWDGIDENGEPLPHGTMVDVSFYAWMEQETYMEDTYAANVRDPEDPQSYRWLISGSYDHWLEWEFPLTLDGAAPKVTAEMDRRAGVVELTVREEHYLSYAAVQDGTGVYLAEEAFDSRQRGVQQILTVDISECSGDKLYVTVADYASNITGYTIDLAALRAGEQPEIRRCYMALFTDVRKDAWYHEAVDFVCEQGLMESSGTLRFEPNQYARRADLLTALYHIAGEPAVDEVEHPFTDVKKNIWYGDAVKWAWSQGIAAGFSETIFAATAAITREQLAVMLYRAAVLGGEFEEYDKAVLDAFADRESVADWAVEAMAWAVGEGILTGDGEGTLRPGSNTTRAELALTLMRFCEE